MNTKCWILLPAIIALAGCNSEPTSAIVDRRDIEGYLVLGGELVTPPTEYADVLPPYHAPVEKVLVTEGKWVNEGAPLMTLSFQNVQASLEQARTNMKTAQANYANARASLDDEVKRFESEIVNLQNRQAAGEEVTAQLEIARQQLFDAKRMLEANMAPYKADLNTAQHNLQQAQAGAKQASVRAPISGTVLKVHVAAGQVVGDDRSKPVATICDLASLVVHAPLTSEQIGYVKRRMEVTVTFDGLVEDFPGRVERIITRTDGDQVGYVAVVSFENKQGLVKPGATLKGVAVKTGEVNDVIAVPSEAIDKDSSGKPVVRVLTGSDWIPTVVEVGLSGNGYTEIKSGLKEGQTVQVTP